MSYCTIDDVKKLLPPSMSIGDNNIGTPVPNRPGNQGSKRSDFSLAEMQIIISYAEQEIDSRLNQMFVCPLRRIKIYETNILNNISSGTNISVMLGDTGPFNINCLVRLQDISNIENCTISSVTDLSTIVLSSIVNSYDKNQTLISILGYPAPIPLTCARLALAYGIDKYFVSEQSPDVSNYGKNLRNLANMSLESITTGQTQLAGQEFTNYRFIRGTLYSGYRTPVPSVQKGQEKE